MQNKERHRLAREKEAAFLLAYYRKGSETRLDRRASAIAAGYPVTRAAWSANRILDKYSEAPFRDCAEIVGINKAQMAVLLAEFMENSEGKDKLSSIRLMMANLGEATDNRDAPRGMTFQGPTMVIMGATPERIRALRCAGTVPELSSASEQKQQPQRQPRLGVVEAPKQPR